MHQINTLIDDANLPICLTIAPCSFFRTAPFRKHVALASFDIQNVLSIHAILHCHERPRIDYHNDRRHFPHSFRIDCRNPMCIHVVVAATSNRALNHNHKQMKTEIL